MDEFTANAFANRDDPIPVIRLDPIDDLNDDVDDTNEVPRKEGTRERLRRHKSELKENLKKAHSKASETSSTVQDRLLEKYVKILYCNVWAVLTTLDYYNKLYLSRISAKIAKMRRPPPQPLSKDLPSI